MTKKFISVISVILVLGWITGCGGKNTLVKQGLMDTPQAHYTQGKSLLKEGKIDEARKEFNRAIHLDQKFAPGYEGMSLVYMLKGDIKSAHKYVDKSIGLNNKWVPAYVAKGRIFSAEGKYKDGISWFDKALKMDKANEDAYIYKGEAYIKLNDYDNAENTYKEGLNAIPNSTTLNDKWKDLQDIRRASAGLPPEYVAIARTPAITRADLAALFVVELNLDKVMKKRGAPEYKKFYAPESNIMGKKEEKTSPQFPQDIQNHWAKHYIEKVINYGIMEPYPDGTFKPDEKLTRANFALFVQNFLIKVTGDNGLSTRFIGSASPFPDVPNSHYAFNAIMVVTTRGIMKAKLDGTFGLTEPVPGKDALLILKKVKANL